MKTTRGKLWLAYGLFLVLAADVFAAGINDKPAKEATQAQSTTTNVATVAQQQQKSDTPAVAKRPQISKGQATRDLIVTLVGLLGFVGLISFLLRRPKDLDKYEKMYAALREEHNKRKAEQQLT